MKPPRSHIDHVLSFQNDLNITSSESGNSKFSIGSLNNKFPFMFKKLLNILQSACFCEVKISTLAINVKETTQ